MSGHYTIGILVRQFPNIVQTYVLNHIMAIRDAGTETLIIAERDPQLDVVHPDITGHRLLDDTVYVHINRDRILSELLSTPLWNPRYLALALRVLLSPALCGFGLAYRLRAMLRCRVMLKKPLDIIHSHSLFSTHQYLFLERCFGIPIVTTFHGLVPNNVAMLSSDRIEQVFEDGEAFLCNTHFAERQLQSMHCPQQKIHIIPQGTNTADFPYRERAISEEDEIIVLSVGRLSVEKGFHIAIDAIARLVERLPRLRYRIIGRGLEQDALQARIDDMGLVENVQLLSGVSTEELQRQYASAHMFVLPSIEMQDGSHTETQGVVLQEAQSSGLPVIASRTGGIPEMIHHEQTGLLFDEHDDEQLAAHIARLINDPLFYDTLRVQARKDVDDHLSREAIHERQDALYRKVLDR